VLRPSFFPSLGCREQREVSTIRIAHLVAKSLTNQVAVFHVLRAELDCFHSAALFTGRLFVRGDRECYDGIRR
jgi:hypothetical protein